ncbi:M48 family metallopeptidase, partial [Chloroflexota bacterium]
IRPLSGIRVAIPRGVTMEKAKQFVLEKSDWIKKHRQMAQRHDRETGITQELADGIDRAVARKKLGARLNYLAQKHGYSYNRLYLRKQRTRWGSCSSKNNISLNMKLVLLPDDLIDYVILHELVHTRIKNHGKRFWAELEGFDIDKEDVKKRLKKYGMWL